MYFSKSVLILIFIILKSGVEVKTEFFSSQVELESLYYLKMGVIDIVEEYLQENKGNISNEVEFKLETFIEQGKSNGTEFDLRNSVENPLNAFLLIKSIAIDLLEILNKNRLKALGKKLELLKQVYLFPKIEDVSGAAIALTRLQDIYKLNPKEMTEGILYGHCCASKFNAEDTFEVGKQCYLAKDYQHSMEWLKEALIQFKNSNKSQFTNSTKLHKDIQEYLSYSENYLLGLEISKNFLSYAVDMSYDDLMDQFLLFTGEKKHQVEVDGKKVDSTKVSFIKSNYEKLCRGDNIAKQSINPNLKCRYTAPHPYFLLAPIKEEILNLDPKIWLYHAVFFEKEMDTIVNTAEPKLYRSMVQNFLSGGSSPSLARISKIAWLTPEDHQVVAKIDKRIQLITGLSMDNAEELQIANYGIGGHYEPHFDFSYGDQVPLYTTESEGNRIATFLSYLSDVTVGGATVFPLLDVAIFPEKGSAAFWYNLYDNGEGDFRTKHGACPVLIGSKWASNKWIHERGQEFIYPCKIKNP